MQPTIKVLVEFDWKGDTLSIQAELDLPVSLTHVDDFMIQLHAQIARQNGLDLDSVQYEWMLSNPVQIIDFKTQTNIDIPNLPMDIVDFLPIYQSMATETHLQKIANNFALNVNSNPNLTLALKAAYLLGREHR